MILVGRGVNLSECWFNTPIFVNFPGNFVNGIHLIWIGNHHPRGKGIPLWGTNEGGITLDKEGGYKRKNPMTGIIGSDCWTQIRELYLKCRD